MLHKRWAAHEGDVIAAVAAPVPPRIVPPSAPLGRLAFIAAFVRNPLETIPRAVYEEDSHEGRGRVWITSPALIRTVLLDEREKFQKVAQIRLLAPLLGRGLLTSEGAEWRWQRQASAPMFRHQDLLAFVPQFVRAAAQAAQRWRAAAAGRREPQVQAIDRDMARATFDVISATLLPSADATVAPVVEGAMAAFQRWAGWGILYATTGMPAWLPRPGMIASARAIATLRGAVLAMLREKGSGPFLQEKGPGPFSQPDDLMHRLMLARDPETGQSMDERQRVDNLLTFYLAGHETTARALTWTLYLLARSPEWTERLEEEIAAVTRGAPIAAEHLERLVQVQQVLKESMRLYPPVPLMGRQAVVATRLGAHALARGETVMMPIYAMHRHAKRWRDPDAFDPARFAPPREAQLERYQYLPFGAGPRICIGMAFAMMEATAMLATLLQHARFATVEGHEPLPVARVTLLPRGGMPLRVTLR
jgi:cytochrome P450